MPKLSLSRALLAACAVAMPACGRSKGDAILDGASAGAGRGSAGADDGSAGADGGSAGADGGSAGIDGGSAGTASCSFQVAPTVPAAVDPGASFEERARGEQLLILDRLIGRYLRGDVRVYRGTMQATDNASQLVNTEVYGPRPDDVIAAGPALAMLDVREASGGDWFPPRNGDPGRSAFLVLHGPADAQHIVLEQPESDELLTEAGLISPRATTSSLALSCMSCAPSLWARPDALSFTDLTATGTVSVMHGYASQGATYVDVTERLTASATLTVAPACSIQFDDLVVLNTATGPDEVDISMDYFQRSGREMVWHTSGGFSAPGTPCPTDTPYTIDVYVDLDDLAHYGTRNFALGTPIQVCPI